MKNIIETLTNVGATFASFTYKSKKSGEVARYTVILGGNYINLLEKSILELELLISENKFVGIELEAANKKLASLNKSLVAHKNGTQNEDYTKKGQYTSLGNGVNVNTKDNTLQVFGVKLTKKVLVEGVHKIVNSRPLTIATKKVEKMLPISNFREYAFDMGNIQMVKVDGQTVVFQTQHDLTEAVETAVVA
jgi:hypothetical protein